MKQKFIVLTIIIVFLFVLGMAGEVFAQGGAVECPAGQGPDGRGGCKLTNPAPRQLVNIPDFPTLVAQIIQTLLAVAGAVAVVFLMIGGFLYVTAHGNEEATEKAKKTVTGAIIGIVIIVLAYAIVAIVNNLLVNPPGGGPAPGSDLNV